MPRNFKDDGDREVTPMRSAGGSSRTPTSSTMAPSTTILSDIYAMDYFDISEEDLKLKEWERRLNEEVDEDLFQEPKKFNTLHRVIDVLGLQMIDGAAGGKDGTNRGGSGRHVSGSNDLEHNPAYRSLKAQQQIVEGAIEHMAVIHCADLNGSVIQVGKVARQFSDAVSKVRHLRKQVRDIQDTLGASAEQQAAEADINDKNKKDQNKKNKAAKDAAEEKDDGRGGGGGTTAAAMSLRELWMKKLECEATLALLEKLDIIRAAPMQFDQLISPPTPRIGAAVITVTYALQTMFNDDVAQVQALHKIMEQLLLRKQKAEEICWDTLADVIFLRTGNGFLLLLAKKQNSSKKGGKNTITNLPDSKDSGVMALSAGGLALGGAHSFMGASDMIYNPFLDGKTRYAIEEDNDDYFMNNNTSTNDGNNANDDDSVRSDHSGASLFSLEDDDNNNNTNEPAIATTTNNSKAKSTDMTATTASSTLSDPQTSKILANMNRCRMMIPLPIIEAELDLEADERRCLEEIALSGMFKHITTGGISSTTTGPSGSLRHRHHALPRYADPILALRILVECIAKLNRLDDIERMIHDRLNDEIRSIVKREQARTFTRLERLRRAAHQFKGTGTTATIRLKDQNKATDTFKEFRRHLTGMLCAFGTVLVRLSHLAEVLRIRISSDRELLQKTESPSSLMRNVISAAISKMHDEIKEFLKPCLYKFDEVDGKDGMGNQPVGEGSTAFETGLFSLGVIENESKNGKTPMSTATRSNVMEMSTDKFVTTILFPKTGLEPEVRNALSFRRSIARWTYETENLKKELAIITNEDMSSAAYRFEPKESAIVFLDHVIQQDLLPVLQKEAEDGTIQGLQRAGAFDPILGRTMFNQSHNNGPDDIEMCLACKTMFESTGPLFMALHRLPRGGEMYLPIVAVLEHVLLTFISRVKQQVSRITDNKTALMLVMKEGKGPSLSAIMERRKPAILLLRAYTDSDGIDSLDDVEKHGGGEINPLSPPPGDTLSRRNASGDKAYNPLDDIPEGVEGEEQLLKLEIAYLKQHLDFDSGGQSSKIVVCSDDELMKAACLAHNLLKLAGLLEKRLIIRSSSGLNKSLTSTRALREAIKTIKMNGMKMAKFCRLEMLMQTIQRMCKICTSSTLVARDAVRIPSSVNDLGEYLTGASDNLREAAGNAVAAYAFSSLEQYIPFCLMQTVRVIIAGRGIISKSPLTLNGIEALDRSGSVLYRDLKGATSFNNSFWDMELAAISFECSASFIAMMELEMEELIAYYTANRDEFSEEDFRLMFTMTGPRRHGDINQYNMVKKELEAAAGKQ